MLKKLINNVQHSCVIFIIGVLSQLMTSHNHVLAISCGGCVDMDEINFNATIEHFPYAIVKFDIAFPYGEKHEAFADFSKAAHKVTDELLVGTVGIKDYGELENKELGLRFDIDDKSFPGIILFKGKLQDFVRFPAYLDITLNNLKTFVTENTELYIGRSGCLKQFNEIAKNYANLNDDKQLELIQKAEELSEKLAKKDEQFNAKSYILFMRKINAKGYDFVDEETKRILRLRASKVSDAKKLELTHKLNILESFHVSKLTKPNKLNDKEDL